MGNKRKEIREAFVAHIIAANTAAGVKVYENRARPVWQDNLPAINVWTDRETVDLLNAAPKIYRRTLEVVVEIYADSKANIDDMLDMVSNQVENAFDTEDRFTLQASTSDITYAGSEMGLIESGTRQTGICRIHYDVEYISHAGVDPATLDDFLRADVSYKLEGQATQPVTVDEIDLPNI